MVEASPLAFIQQAGESYLLITNMAAVIKMEEPSIMMLPLMIVGDMLIHPTVLPLFMVWTKISGYLGEIVSLEFNLLTILMHSHPPTSNL